MRRGLRRRVSRCSVGVGLLAGSYAAVRRPGITEAEERVFRWANEADDRLRTPVRAVMQAGTFITVPIIAIVAFLAGRRALAVRVLLAGTAAWLGAKAIQPHGARGRGDKPAGGAGPRGGGWGGGGGGREPLGGAPGGASPPPAPRPPPPPG